MSAPFKFKLKVKREDGGAPSNSQQPSQQQQPGYGGLNAQHPSAGLSGAPSSQQWNNGQQQASGLQSSAPSGKIRLKVKMGTGSHPAAPQQQHWDAPHVPPPPPPVRLKREPQDWEHGGRPPAAATSGAAPAGAGAGPPPVKKIKLSMGKPKLAVAAGGGEAAAGGGFGGGGLPPPLPKKKPIIKFKPPPKQPRDAAAAAAVGAAAAADGGLGGPEPSLLPRTSTLPIVRLTLPVVAGGGGLPAGAPRRLKNIKLKAARPLGRQGGGGGPSGLGPRAKKLKPRRAAATSPDGFGLGGGAPQRRPKRSKSDLKELRDLGIDDFDLDEYDPDEPIAPRTFTLRSTHAGKAATQAPSSTGLGLSTGGPAPSDARTGGGGAAAVDTAGTEAAPDEVYALGAAGAGEGRRQLPAVPALASGPPTREAFERLLVRCQKKDVHNMFKEPVTEQIAPGYFAVVKQPMDFGTMRGKATKGEYSTWEELRADMRLMFTNALTYNAEGGNIWNYAKLLMGQCDRIVELAMQGKSDLRASATITRKHNAQVKAQQRAEREALRAHFRAEQRAAQEAKVLKKAGLASATDEHEDEAVRGSYRRPARDANVARWRGLGAGANAEGVAWGPGRQVLRPVNPWLPPGMYAQSLARFASGLAGRARQLVQQRALAAQANSAEAERALKVQLAKKVPLPPPLPPQPAAAAPAAAAAASAAAAGRMPAAGSGLLPSGGGGAALAPNPAALLQAQQMQMMMQVHAHAAAGRTQGMPGMRPTLGGMQLPPGASISIMHTPQGMVPFLIQPGQQPVMLGTLPGAGAAPGQRPAGGAPGMMLPQGAGFPAGFPGFPPGAMPLPRPAGK